MGETKKLWHLKGYDPSHVKGMSAASDLLENLRANQAKPTAKLRLRGLYWAFRNDVSYRGINRGIRTLRRSVYQQLTKLRRN